MKLVFLKIPNGTILLVFHNLVTIQNKQNKNYDRRHCTAELPTFEEDKPVFVATGKDYVPVLGGIVRTTRDRSYEVQLPFRVVRRNRSYIHSHPGKPVHLSQIPPNSFCGSPFVIQSRSSIVIQPPDQLTNLTLLS